MDNNEMLKQAEHKSLMGDRFFNMLKTGTWETIENQILKPIEKEAFEVYKKVDPSDLAAVTQAQMMSKIVDTIRAKMQSTIDEGKLAKQQIKQIGEEENG